MIFKDLKYSSKTSIELCRWAIAAGVAKRITFHSARHTHATLLLSHGVDIHTVSKLLGHKHVVSTERYAHVTDKLKTKAINKLAKIHSDQIGLRAGYLTGAEYVIDGGHSPSAPLYC